MNIELCWWINDKGWKMMNIELCWWINDKGWIKNEYWIMLIHKWQRMNKEWILSYADE